MINVEFTEKVKSLKEKVREKEGTGVWPRLTKNSRELNDEDTMEACKITKGDSLRVTAGLLGGMMSHSQGKKNRRRSAARSRKRESNAETNEGGKEDHRDQKGKESEAKSQEACRRVKESEAKNREACRRLNEEVEKYGAERRERLRRIVEEKRT